MRIGVKCWDGDCRNYTACAVVSEKSPPPLAALGDADAAGVDLTTVSICDLDTGKPRFEQEVNRSFFGHGRLLTFSAYKPPIFLPDGKWMVWMGQYDNYLVDTATGKWWFRFGWGMQPSSMAVSPNGKTLAMSTEKDVAMIDVAAMEKAADDRRASEFTVQK